ncbi:hypothetical protein PL720_06230, partial [Bifidobacterium breve]|uniref:hypothetical protein n=1 Tax=Bifidobacterium breve TaxID=1685 RepID=UPI001B3C5707
ERTVSELIIATGTGEDQSAQKLGHYQWGWTAFQSNMAFYCVVSIVRIYAIRNAKNRSWNPEQNAIVQSVLIGPRHG